MHAFMKALALTATLSLAACGGSSSQNSSTAKPEAAATVIPLGQKGKTDAFELTVTDVTSTSQVGPAGAGPKAEAGETFVIVGYTLKNVSDKPLLLMARPAVSLIDAKGQSYAPDDIASPMAALLLKDPSGIGADLNPNISAKTKAAWKVDKASFSKADWKLVVASDPQLTFALK